MNEKSGKFDTAAKRWAGMGPYYAMFPTAFCDSVVSRYSREGETVLDPFAGRGTALHSAATAKRHALGIELNPVGWVYAQTKLSPADRDDVDKRMVQIQRLTARYSKQADELPLFFHHCFRRNVRQFLVCARAVLNWRQNLVDRTLMAFLLVHLHGKITDSLSNQMRQTKAMAPGYAIRWWKRGGYQPPRVDPIDFFRRKFEWRYARGTPATASSKIYLGDSVEVLGKLRGNLSCHGIPRPSLLLTSPPYLGISNYHYDQWLRLWLLGGPPTDRRTNNPYAGKHRGKFASLKIYQRLLESVFTSAAKLMTSGGIVYVRTDRREPTLSLTRDLLLEAFPSHRLLMMSRPIRGKTQTRLFGNKDPQVGEVDMILTPRGPK